MADRAPPRTSRTRPRRVFAARLQIAKKQQAKLWELRAATSLAAALAGPAPAKEARDLLAPVYAWFRDGRDTPDLKRAKALLDKTLLDAPAE